MLNLFITFCCIRKHTGEVRSGEHSAKTFLLLLHCFFSPCFENAESVLTRFTESDEVLHVISSKGNSTMFVTTHHRPLIHLCGAKIFMHTDLWSAHHSEHLFSLLSQRAN